MPDVTWSVVIPWTLAVLFLVSAVGNAQRVTKAGGDLAEAQVERDAAIFERSRIEDRARDLLVPVTWVYDLNEQADENVNPYAVARFRLYLVAAYTEIQKALLLDDVEMTDALEVARGVEPPRRLPRYPQTPPFLASPEEIMGVIQSPVPLPDAQANQVREAWKDPAADLHSFTCTDGHRTTVHRSVDLTGDPCMAPSEETGVDPCRKVLR